MADVEVARAVVTIVPSMAGAQKTITEELAGAASSSGVTEAGNKAGTNFASGLGKGLGVAAGATAAVTAAAIKAGEAFVSSAGEVAAYGDNIDKMSQKMGISAESYQEWDFVMQHCGTSMESLKSSMKTMANAASTNSAAFEELGISQEEIANMSQEELFGATIEALQSVEDETTRTYLAGKTLGKGATELGALLNMSAADTAAMRQQVHDLGGVMSNEAVAASAVFQDSLQNMQVSMEGIKNNLMADFMPALSGVMDGISSIFSGDIDAGLDQISESIGGLAEQITEKLPDMFDVGLGIVEAIGKAIIDNLPALAQSALDLLGSFIDFALTNLPMLIDVALNMLLTIANGLIAQIPVMIPAVVDVVLAVVEKLTEPDTLIMLVGAALQLILAIAQGLIAAIPVLLERVPVIIENLFTAITSEEMLGQILNAGITLIDSLIEGIGSMFEDLISTGCELVEQVKDGFLEKVEAAKQWGKDLIDNFIDGILEKWEDLKDTVADVAESVADFIGFSEPEKGPLSNFHTYAPDMMMLFAKGIRDNKDIVTDAMNELAGEIGTNMSITATASGIESLDRYEGASAGGGFTQNLYITSPKALTPSEVARQTRNATRQMVLALQGV